MQLVLELLKKIFVALQGVYTKPETDAALATKADATALTEEAQAREQADAEVEARVGVRLAEHDAEIDTLQKVTAGLGEGAEAAANVAKWQTYATAMQKDLDAETAMQLAQEFSRATDEYLADPTKTKDWSAIKDADGNIVSQCPYFSSEGVDIAVDFSVTKANGYWISQAYWSQAKGCFINSPRILFVPNVSSAYNAFSYAKKLPSLMVFSSLTSVDRFLHNANTQGGHVRVYTPNATSSTYFATSIQGSGVLEWRAPKLKTATGIFDGSTANTFITKFVLDAPNVITLTISAPIPMRELNLLSGLSEVETLRISDGNNATNEFLIVGDLTFPKLLKFANGLKNKRKFNQAMFMPSLRSGDDAFLNSGMSAENISAVLDSLPFDPVGKGGTGVITFTGCPGAAELTQESPSVAAAIAKGWEVRL